MLVPLPIGDHLLDRFGFLDALGQNLCDQAGHLRVRGKAQAYKLRDRQLRDLALLFRGKDLLQASAHFRADDPVLELPLLPGGVQGPGGVAKLAAALEKAFAAAATR